MYLLRRTLIAAVMLVVSPLARSQATEGLIAKQIQDLPMLPDAQRSAATAKIAADVHTLPAGNGKVKQADSLARLVTSGEQGRDTLQSVADTLGAALTETPQPAGKDGQPAAAYLDLARLARYEGATIDSKDPMVSKATEILVANDLDAAKSDFTLKDLDGKKVTLSALRGKIVMVYFWSTYCGPCSKEMSDLDVIYTHFQSQGLVILSLTSENPFNVSRYLAAHGGYHPPVLIDDGGKVARQFHVDQPPRSFVFNAEGKLVAESINMRTQRQFIAMFAKAGLHP